MENKMNNEKAEAENMKKNNNENENELKNTTLKTKQGNLKNGTGTDNFQQEQPIIGEKFRKPIDKSVDNVENSFKEKEVPEYVPENTENEKSKEDMMTKVQNVVNSIGQFSGPVQQLFSKKNNNKTFTSSEIEEENKLSSLNQLKDKGKGNWAKNALPIILGLIIMLALIAIFTKLFKKKENQKTNNDKENLQGNTSIEQGNTSTEQGNTSTEQGNTSTEQGNTSTEQGNTSTEQGNTSTEQGNTSTEQGNTSTEQGNTSTEQGNTSKEQGNTNTEQENTNTEQGNINTKQGNKAKFTIGSKEKNPLKTKSEHIEKEIKNEKNGNSKSDLASKVNKNNKQKSKRNNKKDNVIS